LLLSGLLLLHLTPSIFSWVFLYNEVLLGLEEKGIKTQKAVRTSNLIY
jgi:hypothetical protein